MCDYRITTLDGQSDAEYVKIVHNIGDKTNNSCYYHRRVIASSSVPLPDDLDAWTVIVA